MVSADHSSSVQPSVVPERKAVMMKIDSGSTLIKTLKAAHEPAAAGSGGQSKIALATSAWHDRLLVVPRKADVLRDWVLEAWTRTKPSSTHPILDGAYHELLLDVSPHCAQRSQPALSLLSTFLQCIKLLYPSPPPPPPPPQLTSTSTTSDLWQSSSRSLSLLFSSTDSPHKAESWVEVWITLVDVLSSPTAPGDMLQPVAELVCDGLHSSLASTPNTKKIAQSILPHLAVYAAALDAHPSLQPTLQPLTGHLVFPLTALQIVDPLKPVLAALTAPAADGLTSSNPATAAAAPLTVTLTPAPTLLTPALLAFLPHILNVFIESTIEHRYTLYSRASNDRVPLDVVVADRIRGAVIPALAQALDVVNTFEHALLARPSSSSAAGTVPGSASVIAVAIWSARLGLWRALETWGGYLETDAVAGDLVAAESQRAAGALAAYAASEAEVEDEGVAGRVLRTLDVLERLDHARTGISADIVGWCLASPTRTHPPARTLLLSLVRYHQLTHSLPDLFDLIAAAAQQLFSPTLPADALASLYTLVASGPISDRHFRDDLAAAVRSCNLGGRRSGVWAKILLALADEVRTALSQAGGQVGEKRKRSAASLDGSARLVAVLSRVVKIVLDAGTRARPGSDEVESAIDTVANAFVSSDPPSVVVGEAAAPAADTPAQKKKKRKSDAVVDGTRDIAPDLIYAARLRVARSAELVHRTAQYDLPVAPLCTLTASRDVAPELRLELFHYLYTRLSLRKAERDTGDTGGAIIDAILEVLGLSAKRAWTGREATVTDKTLAAAAWTITAERGLTVFDVAASSSQLDSLATTIVSRAGAVPSAPSSVSAAITRVLSNAETWELSNLRKALLKALVAAAGTLAHGTFAVLLACPAPWLSKPARASLIDAAYAADAAASSASSASSDHAARASIRQWLARLAATTHVLGPLSTDPKVLKRLLKSVSDDGADVPLVESSLALAAEAYTHAVREAPRDPTGLGAILDDALKAKPYSKWARTVSAATATATATATARPDTRSRAIAVLIDTLVDSPRDKFPTDLDQRVRSLVATIRTALEPVTRPALAMPFMFEHVFSVWRTLAAADKWLGDADNNADGNDDIGRRLLAALVQANAALNATLSSPDSAEAPPDSALATRDLSVVARDLAVVAFNLVALSLDARAVLAAFIVLSTRFASTDLDSAFRTFARTLSGPKYEDVIVSAVDLVSSTSSQPDLVAALGAVRLLLSASVEGSGRAIGQVLPDLLAALTSATRRGDAQVVDTALGVIASLVEDRTGLLRAPDVAVIVATIVAALTPDSPSELNGSRARSPTFAPHILASALAPILTLIRHRADLVLDHLPSVVAALSLAFPLLQRSRALVTSRAVRARTRAARPFWLAEEESSAHADHPADAAADRAAAATHAALLLARALSNLATARADTSSSSSTAAAAMAPSTSTATTMRSLAGPLAKHAPALLVAYVRCAADPFASLSTGVRRDLEPGLFALADVITAGGRGADGRGREGEGVGRPFGLGEGVGGDAERQVWADLWLAWARKRYTGQG